MAKLKKIAVYVIIVEAIVLLSLAIAVVFYANRAANGVSDATEEVMKSTWSQDIVGILGQ